MANQIEGGDQRRMGLWAKVGAASSLAGLIYYIIQIAHAVLSLLGF